MNRYVDNRVEGSTNTLNHIPRFRPNRLNTWMFYVKESFNINYDYSFGPEPSGTAWITIFSDELPEYFGCVRNVAVKKMLMMWLSKEKWFIFSMKVLKNRQLRKTRPCSNFRTNVVEPHTTVGCWNGHNQRNIGGLSLSVVFGPAAWGRGESTREALRYMLLSS